LYICINPLLQMEEKRPNKHRVVECSRCPNFRGRVPRGVAHIIKQHVTLQEVPYYCSYCQYRGTRASDVQSHINRVHKGSAKILPGTSPYQPMFSWKGAEDPDLVDSGTTPSCTPSHMGTPVSSPEKILLRDPAPSLFLTVFHL
jgi:hypothetical protein